MLHKIKKHSKLIFAYPLCKDKECKKIALINFAGFILFFYPRRLKTMLQRMSNKLSAKTDVMNKISNIRVNLERVDIFNTGMRSKNPAIAPKTIK